jgi:hypothetical protein
MMMKKRKNMKKKTRVIFNNDEKNYEEFEKLEDAEKFANRYANAKVQYEEKHIKSILEKEEKYEQVCISKNSRS